MELLMNDFKSKMPDIKELGDMACKLFSGIKTSVGEIIKDYHDKRKDNVHQETQATSKTTEINTDDLEKPKQQKKTKKKE